MQPPADGWFDGATVGACVVRRIGNEWRMWYAGRSKVGFDGIMPIATGCVGLATSPDGLLWQRLAGEELGGSVLSPGPVGSFDSTHVAVGDVLLQERPDGGVHYEMYTFGGGSHAPSLGAKQLPVGADMAIGKATSEDGVHWQRSLDPLIEPAAGQVFVGWPQVLPLESMSPQDGGYAMYYHAMR